MKIFIANRGEIAVRLLRAFQDLGLSSVLACTKEDQTTLAFDLAEESFLVPSYLDLEALVQGVRHTGADWVHPGIGFFSEDHRVAERLEREGIGWIGPSAKCLQLLGSKLETKAAAKRLGIPILRDGSLNEVPSSFPIFVKKKEGGGGQGMRCFHEKEHYLEWLEAQREPDSFFWEEAFLQAHHIEMQCVSTSGGVRVVGERDCSIQRRHQKIWEEGPAWVLGDSVRKKCVEQASLLLDEAGLVGVATVEFLVSGERAVLLEVNPRLQVEHGVTECAQGIDLVELQWKSVLGELAVLPKLQGGSAIEVRLMAENPKEAWLPSQGVVGRLSWPGGPGVRVCAGVCEGTEVSTQYDSLLAKIICFGENRGQALRRMRRALRETKLEGVTTNLEWLQVLAENAELEQAPVDCSWLAAQIFEFSSKTQSLCKDIWKKKGVRGEDSDYAQDLGARSQECSRALLARMPSSVRQIFVRVGDTVRQGQLLVLLEAMKMEMEIRAPFAGIVECLHVEEGGHCQQGQECVRIKPEGQKNQEGLDFAFTSV